MLQTHPTAAWSLPQLGSHLHNHSVPVELSVPQEVGQWAPRLGPWCMLHFHHSLVQRVAALPKPAHNIAFQAFKHFYVSQPSAQRHHGDMTSWALESSNHMSPWVPARGLQHHISAILDCIQNAHWQQVSTPLQGHDDRHRHHASPKSLLGLPTHLACISLHHSFTLPFSL
jgi:hypothetical protein